MGGGLMQLVAYGAQDVYLTGNPQITFFKVVYRRHTNFACEAIEQTFNGSPAFGGKATVPITRNGDLVTNMWLHTTVNNTSGNAANMLNEPGYSMIYLLHSLQLVLQQMKQMILMLKLLHMQQLKHSAGVPMLVTH